MKEKNTRENINLELEWYEKHRLKIVSQDPDVQKILDSMDIVTVYEYPPLSRKYSRSNFED
jgi:hypothetical protein